MSEYFMPAPPADMGSWRAVYVNAKQRRIVSIPIVAMRVMRPGSVGEARLVAVVFNDCGFSVDANLYADESKNENRELIFVGVALMQALDMFMFPGDAQATYSSELIAKYTQSGKQQSP